MVTCHLCALCGEVENTMHLLFECAECSEPLWELVGEAITALIRQASSTAQTYQNHAHSAIYNIYDGQLPWQHASQVMAWFQEIKRDIIYCRYKRCMGELSSLTGPCLLGYLINTLRHIVSLYKYQGWNVEGLKSRRDYLTKLIQKMQYSGHPKFSAWKSIAHSVLPVFRGTYSYNKKLNFFCLYSIQVLFYFRRFFRCCVWA
jgi:hypothetical protein